MIFVKDIRVINFIITPAEEGYFNMKEKFLIEKAARDFGYPYWCYICQFRTKRAKFLGGFQYSPRPLYSLRHAKFHMKRHLDIGHEPLSENVINLTNFLG
jgi:hypothetical protein